MSRIWLRRLFAGLAILLVGLKVVQFGLVNDWRFLAVHPAASLREAVIWRDWLDLFVILLEGVAAAAAITLVSVTLNQNVMYVINNLDKIGRLEEEVQAREAIIQKQEANVTHLRETEAALKSRLDADRELFDKLQAELAPLVKQIKRLQQPDGKDT